MRSSHHQESRNANSEFQFLESYKRSFDFPAATQEIKNLSEFQGVEREEVCLHGYLGSRSDLSKTLCFVPLISKDLDYSVQVVSSATSDGERTRVAHARLKALEPNSPVAFTGLLKSREPAASQDLGDKKKIKHVEVQLQDVHCLNNFPNDIIATPETVFPPEQRHLQIRTDKSVRDALAFRSKAAIVCRDQLSNSQSFLEVETPLLFKSTPEGAREFLVPTRHRGWAYALPQSPQQYKQILMASGISRYYQIAKCFRDEDLRADRQPEFTQLDLEMSFASGEDVMQCIEQLIRRLWAELLGVGSLPNPFPSMTYHQAMTKFGSDKPDIRIGMEISAIGHLIPADLMSMIGPLTHPLVEVMKFQVADEPAETRKFVNTFMDSPDSAAFQKNPDGGPGIFVFDSRKPLRGLQPFGFEAAEQVEEMLGLEDGDLVILQARKNKPYSGGSTPLGNLRIALHRAAVAQGYLAAPKGFDFLWITDFPLFSPTNDAEPGQGGAAGLASTHHPFTSPKSAEDADMLLEDPTKVVGEHYDLIVNGVELGGGSRRIHHATVQEFILKDVLKMSPERLQEFSHLLEVLRAGCPPHAGIALGFDRLIAVMLGKTSVRDVIAFPKSGRGEDLLVKSPSRITEEALETYHLQLRK
ncbi:MAG: hypothetical protein M1830_002168 [Pleopsidium flavum]|nr:MAG: hypothetical protein M1830_002168 [Pleopsidium flavum]